MQKISNDIEVGKSELSSHTGVSDAIKATSETLTNIINFTRRNLSDITIVKKDGTKEKYNIEKVVDAIKKSATRLLIDFNEKEIKDICNFVNKAVLDMNSNQVEIIQMHNIVEAALQAIKPQVAESYRNYINYKTDFVHMLDKVYQESQRIMYIGDK